jgi:hypothetical protein
MSIARFAGPAGRAVARQVHRRVRQTCEVSKFHDHVLDAATARPASVRGQPWVAWLSCSRPLRTDSQRALPATADGPTKWIMLALGACEAVWREALIETGRPYSPLRHLGFSFAPRPKQCFHSALRFPQGNYLAGATALTWVLSEARVLAWLCVFLFGCLTFEVTCTRQRDALARQGIMSIARHAGQVWHAVARQVHRMVRHRLLRAGGQARFHCLLACP